MPQPSFTRRTVLGTLGAAALTASTAVRAQGKWPDKPIKLVVPFAAGVSPDVVSRILAEPLGRALGQPLIIDNRAGAAGIIGAEVAARSPGDGYTLFMTVNSIMGINPAVYTKLPYDVQKDFAPVTLVARVPYVLITGMNQPDTTLKALLARAKAKPDSVEYGSLGVGSGPHVVMEMMNNMAGIKMVHVAYKGSPVQDVIAGQVPLAFDPATTAIPLVKGGKARALAITSPKRSPALPDVPTVAELLPGYDGDGWQGFYMPAGTPKEIVARMNTEIVKVLRQPDVQNKLIDLGLQPVGNSIDDFSRISRDEYDKWARIAKANNIRVE
ncbi:MULTISPECIES: Bug family tripartite tricarboxylate transporter substrate binding protein [Ramlibacter]|uniref:Tripartite tricarboxylate transporter substrate binding protein n=1 Tax=Ramlibacter pinisoli TaxID=2682844 RepID=A0A6N8IQ00_9BURK|nr:MULTISPECIES: tripartite tricarboxylate transporter substrate binding protein [Ramlibacter]MBA2963679.1 tripartite tricarboxylate transporter substrate binding protein [Ramlibacter sp. CGMCC 1.13660]MVQ28645.1 tripartite tricarboxylate transporter substrate binding protein [Ramlibacter pinisoli]